MLKVTHRRESFTDERDSAAEYIYNAHIYVLYSHACFECSLQDIHIRPFLISHWS